MSFVWGPLAPAGALLLGGDPADPAPSAPGTTLAALQAGGFPQKLVAAIYGYPYLVSNAPETPVLTAWAGLDWTQALGGLVCEVGNDQAINPWDPFATGAPLQLFVKPDSTDGTFAVDTHCSSGGAETESDDTVGPDDTPITVRSTSAFASSGTAYIGTEAFGYTGKTATTFTGVTRGKWAPFTVDGGSSSRFGQRHQITTDPNAIKLRPQVTALPREWLGKWVGVWLHRWSEENQLLNTRADARLVFAGRIVAIRDDAASMATAVKCDHVLDVIKRAQLGTDLWSAKMKEGIFLSEGMTFEMRDTADAGATWTTANDLEVVTGAPTPPNQIEEGFYTVEELHSAINDWLTAEKAASRINGFYHIGIAPYGPANNAQRTYFSYNIQGAGPTVDFKLIYPKRVSKFFGRLDDGLLGSHATLFAEPGSENDTDIDRVGHSVPLRALISVSDFYSQGSLPVVDVVDERGTFVDQAGTTVYDPPGAGEVGIVIIGNKYIVGCLKNGDTLSEIQPISTISLAGSATFNELFEDIEYTIEDDISPMVIRQVLVHQDTFANVLKKIFYTTNGDSYNHATFDVLPKQLGIGIPGELLGDAFEESVDNLPGANSPCTLVIDRTVTFAEQFGAELVWRWAFLRWMDEGLQFSTWNTPTTGTALTESNKAAAAEVEDNHRTVTELHNDWQRQSITVRYDRDIREFDPEGGYRSDKTFPDPAALENAGGDAKLATLNLRNTYGDDGVEELEGNFKTVAPLFTRPFRTLRRTIDSRLFETIGPGDSVVVTDEFARDPDTGRRGIAARPAIITRHKWNLGGEGPSGSIGDVYGEVDLMLLPLLRVVQYVPTAQLDDTAANGGLDAATERVATCYAHKFSESTEAVDASYFTAGRKIRFIEMDPPDPAAPSTHDAEVESQTGNTITLTAATAFTTFDNTKKYKIVFDTYSDSIAAQQAAFAYQADDADGMIADTRAPFQYSNPPLTGTSTANAANDPIELPADNTYGDGVGLDVGTDCAINRLINNLHDFKMPFSMPYVDAEMSGATVSGTWLLVEVSPIWLTAEKRNAFIGRTLSVAPMLKSSDGASASVRISLVRQRPQEDDLNDVARGTLLAEATFTTTSTTYAVATAQDLTIGLIPMHSGHAYLLVECTVKARTMGIALCQESARTS